MRIIEQLLLIVSGILFSLGCNFATSNQLPKGITIILSGMFFSFASLILAASYEKALGKGTGKENLGKNFYSVLTDKEYRFQLNKVSISRLGSVILLSAISILLFVASFYLSNNYC